MRKQEK